MSVEDLAVVLNHAPELRGTRKLVLVGVANHTGEDRRGWVTNRRLATYTGVDARNVREAVAWLDAQGYITRHVQEGGHLRMPPAARPNLYELHVECPSDCNGRRGHECGTSWFEDPNRASESDSAGQTPPDASILPPPDASILPPRMPASPPREPSLEPSSSPPFPPHGTKGAEQGSEAEERGGGRDGAAALRARLAEAGIRGCGDTRHDADLAQLVDEHGIDALVAVALDGEPPQHIRGVLHRLHDPARLRPPSSVVELPRPALRFACPTCDNGVTVGSVCGTCRADWLAGDLDVEPQPMTHPNPPPGERRYA